jgi:hypothetical protein
MEELQILQVAATIDDVRIKPNKTLHLKVESQENVPDEVLQRFSTVVGKYGHLCFLPDRRINIDDVAGLPDLIEEDGGKSPAVRQRGVLYRIWEQGGKHGEFELAYRTEMEKILDKLKERLT